MVAQKRPSGTGQQAKPQERNPSGKKPVGENCTSTTATKKRKAKTKPEPVRVSGADAAQLLGISRSWLHKLMGQGVFTVVAHKDGRGRGRRVFLMKDELDIYAVSSDADKVREYRFDTGRLKHD